MIARRRLTITPMYDPVSRRWFVEEFEVEAPTLCELLKKLPPGTKLTNYFPDGAPKQKFEIDRLPRKLRPSLVDVGLKEGRISRTVVFGHNY